MLSECSVTKLQASSMFYNMESAAWTEAAAQLV